MICCETALRSRSQTSAVRFGQKYGPPSSRGSRLGPSLERFNVTCLPPDKNASPEANRCFQASCSHLLTQTVGDINNVIRPELDIRSLVFHDLFHIEGNLFPLCAAVGAKNS